MAPFQKSVNYLQFYKIFHVMRQATLKEEKVARAQSGKANVPIPKGSMDEEDKLCPVCLDRPSSIILPDCNHAFCEECLAQWNQKSGTCPLCRRNSDMTGNEVWVLAGEGPSAHELGNYFADFLESLS